MAIHNVAVRAKISLITTGSRTRNAFTLVELLVVITIIAILSGSAAIMIRAPITQATRDQLVADLKLIDSTARHRSSTGKLLTIEYNTRNQLVLLRDASGDSSSLTIRVESNFRIGEILGVANDNRSVSRIEFDQFGISPTYAVSIQGDSGDDHWLLFLGLSGQCYTFDNEDAARAFFQ